MKYFHGIFDTVNYYSKKKKITYMREKKFDLLALK